MSWAGSIGKAVLPEKEGLLGEANTIFPNIIFPLIDPDAPPGAGVAGAQLLSQIYISPSTSSSKPSLPNLSC